MTLTKLQAIEMFGSQAEIGRALGISRSAISLWPDVLDQRKTDELVGAATRLGKPLPDGFVVAEQAAAA
jgi:hypothetical protein